MFQDGSDAAGIVPRVSLFTSRERSAAHPSSRSVWHVRRRGRLSTSICLRRRATTEGEDGRGDSSLRVPNPPPPRRSAPSVQWKGPAAWALIRTVSRTVELSFQSSFHLSLAVLVRYRSRARIEPWMESTTRLWAAIPNNPTLGRRSSGGATSGPRARGSHPLRRSLPRDSEGDGSAAIASLGLQLRHLVGVGFQPWAGSRFTRRY